MVAITEILQNRGQAEELTPEENVKKIYKEQKLSRSFLEKYRPDPAWFTREEGNNRIHGISHETRVLILQEYLATICTTLYPGIQLDREALRWAAATHDTKREDDNGDPHHGERAAAFASIHLQNKIPDNTRFKVMYINEGHAKDDVIVEDEEGI